MSKQATLAKRAKDCLNAPGLITMPCCFDAFSARLIQQAEFPLTFMSGFAVSAARLGLPDTGLISYGEMLDQGRNICAAVDIPVFGDGDTGYGNPMNAKRTVEGYIQAGFAGIMVEDQVSPKRCGHTEGKEVVGRNEAMERMGAVIEARDEARALGNDIVVIARTDARATRGLEEALARAQAFHDLGADLLFVEAPRSTVEMQHICDTLSGPKMVNLLEQGVTPLLSHDELETMGFKVAAYPLTLISTAALAMQNALSKLKQGATVNSLLSFDEIKDVVGFNEYNETLNRLTSDS